MLLFLFLLVSRQDTSANHVVAALKYNITRSNSVLSMAKPPLIRPATFLYNSKNARVENPTSPLPTVTKDNNNYDNSVTSRIVCKRYFLFNFPLNAFLILFIFVIVKMAKLELFKILTHFIWPVGSNHFIRT